MIYTVIADTEKFRTLSEIIQNRDCQNTWQPLTLIPESVLDYIRNTKNEEARLERIAAYSTLFFALSEIYGKCGVKLGRTEYNKPYLIDERIYVSISHTDGAVAVALSDEYEIGVDIQSEINMDSAARLEKRFFTDINIKEENIGVNILRMNIAADIARLEETKIEPLQNDFTARWAYCESLLKCDGRGFASINNIDEILKQTKVSIKNIKVNSKQFAVATAIKSVIM